MGVQLAAVWFFFRPKSDNITWIKIFLRKGLIAFNVSAILRLPFNCTCVQAFERASFKSCYHDNKDTVKDSQELDQNAMQPQVFWFISKVTFCFSSLESVLQLCLILNATVENKNMMLLPEVCRKLIKIEDNMVTFRTSCSCWLEGTVHPQIKIQSLPTQPHVDRKSGEVSKATKHLVSGVQKNIASESP